MFIYLCSLILLSFCLIQNVSTTSTCKFQNGKYDLSALDRPSGWPVPGLIMNGTKFHYLISLCRPLNFSSTVHAEGCKKSSVCMVSNDSAISFGNSLENTSDYAIGANIGTGFSLYVLTDSLCNSNRKCRANINFICGSHLGSPELTLSNQYQANFVWRTSAACPVKPKNQVPCYVLDEEGNKRDLSPLIRKINGYSVHSANTTIDFIINVCSDLSFDSTDNKCPVNSSACRIIGNEFYSFGSVSEGLKYTEEGLVLTYTTSNSSILPPDCSLKPKTTIYFKCPKRGFSQPPKLISDSNCHYEVLWETEYACPENLLKGHLKSCQFTRESHGIEIDLSPLQKKSPYNVTNPGTSTYYLISICSGLSEESKCANKSWKSTSVCVYNSGLSEVGGSTDSAKFLYADGEVKLIYLKGDFCNGTEQTSIINFKCDLNATNNGDGEPQLIASDTCNHIFEWHTKHACLKHPLDTPCSVTFDKKTVNLQKLLLLDGEPWEAIDGRTSQPVNQAEYYINVCGPISKLGNYSKCGYGSAACVLNNEGKYINLGNFTTPPVYDRASNSVKLFYSGGSLCNTTKFWQSSINFICKPGQISSTPVLIRIDEIDCHYEFEWETADACPVGRIDGSDCKIIDNNLGMKYDLNPLKYKTYKVYLDVYEFYLGVCEPIKDSPCSSNKDSSDNIGVCLVNKFNKTTWKAGESTSKLTYMDGVVNLTYLSGDPYHDQNHTARVTIIIFICDFNAGNGNPRFIEVEDFAFVFHWYTSLVCPQPVSTECLVHDPFSLHLYDLSGLALAENNWTTIVNEDDKVRQFYLNVCQPLTFSITGCDPSAAACLTERDESGKEIAVVPNVGRAINPPVFQSAGHITLTYTDGNSCVSFGNNVSYSTVIHFLCIDESSLQSRIRFLGKVGSCEYSFLWPTKAACPTERLQSNDCQLTDPDSGFTFDLMPLHQINEPYSVPSPSGGNFQFNICGKVNNGCLNSDGSKQIKNISVCEIDSKGNLISNLAVSDSFILSYAAGRYLTHTYKSIDHTKEIIISFPCSHSSSSPPKPEFLRYENGQNTIIFEFKTSLTCIPKPFDCNGLDDLGQVYDFSSLAKYSNGNWEVSDFRPEYSHLKYHINFCRPLNKISSYKCPGGASSACQTSLHNSKNVGYDLGSIMSKPIINSNGTTVFHYSGGSDCHIGQFKRSTTITLFCSLEQSEIRFIGETPECEYIFELETPVACPLKSNLGQNCIVKEPMFGYTFDLNPLKNKNKNYNVREGEFLYFFNVCGKLNGFNNMCANSSACQLKPSDPNFSKSLGLTNDVLEYRDGLIMLEYKSGTGNCHGKYNRTTKIIFMCHHAHEDKDGPVFVAEAEDCTYQFEWPTVHACPPFDVIECTVVDDKGAYYDLSRLSLPNENYYIKYPETNKTFVINVCRSVVHTRNSLCPYTSATCLIDSSKLEPVNLGGVLHAPYFENGKIKIQYTSGDPCHEEDAQSARFFQTVIEFACDPSLIDSEPVFIGRDGCTYYFDWSTAYACPPKAIDIKGDCTVKDPITGYIFNLSMLKNQGIFKYKNGDHQYFLNICGSNNSSPCGVSAGMCQEELSGKKRHWLGGKLNYNLTYSNGVLLLNYTEGDSCHGGQFQRNTLIEFHCGIGMNEPQFLYESHDCTYFFSWKTELACQKHRHCAIKNGSLYYNLISLAESHHIAASAIVNDNASYYVSVCNSLEEIGGVYCPLGAAICRVSRDALSSSNLAESLGKVEYPPFVDFMGHATIIYTNGSTCLKNPDYVNRARIIFLCDADSGIGEPVLIEISDDCVYLFEWHTNVVCPERPEIQPSFTTCNYSDSSRGIHFDLLPLRKTGSNPYYEVFEDESMTFMLNICSDIQFSNQTKCGEAGVCGHSGNVVFNYGIASSQKFNYRGGRLRLTYYDGDDCPTGMNGKRTSEIFFVCDEIAGVGEPVLHRRYTCLVIFMWKTSFVCQSNQRQCAFNIHGKYFDFNLLSSLSHNWLSTDANNITYWINICRGIQPTDDTFGCSPTSAICMMNRKGYHYSLGTLQSMQVKPINSTDLLLTFENGDSRACFSINYASTMQPITRLFMRCGRTLGQPRIFSGPDSKCYYDFVWESSLACADKAEEIMIEKDGIVKDNRLDFSFDIKDILNRTFTVPGTSKNENYIYKINLSGGISQNKSDSTSTCYKAAVCQTKPNTNFERDIGSFETRTFIIRGAELHLVLKSLARPCGKNHSKAVTTIINMQCASAPGIGSPEFIYESGNCDYVFEWSTIVICPDYHRKNVGPNIEPKPFLDVPDSHHKAEIAIGVIFGIISALIIIFIIIKAERRAIISSRFRSLFGRVNLPYFRYKRGDILTELQSDF